MSLPKKAKFQGKWWNVIGKYENDSFKGYDCGLHLVDEEGNREKVSCGLIEETK